MGTLVCLVRRAVYALLVVASGAGYAGGGAAEWPPATTYWHNWTDGKSVSHLTKCEFSKFDLEAMAPLPIQNG